MKRLQLRKKDLLQKGMFPGAALGVLTALVFGVGSSFGAGTDTNNQTVAQTQNGTGAGWVIDTVVGAYRYYGADGQMWTNAITPDGYYVDRNGVMIHPQYEIEKLTTIPADAKSLLVIEGHGNAARATFYLKEETAAVPKNPVSDHSPAQKTAEAAASRLRLGPGAEQLPAETTSASSGQEPSFTWKTVFNTNSTLGRRGIGKEAEGDEKTPRGFYTLDIAFGTEPDPGNFKVPYLQVHDGHYWVGDSESPYYNQLVDIRQTGDVFNKQASEHLSTIAGIGYHYCMSVGYNKECTPYKGSAIFLHCIEGPVTAGCIAIPKEDMVTLLENIQQPAYILIDDGENLSKY